MVGIPSLRLLYLFNYSDESLYKWLDIIKVLKGLENKDSIGLNNEEKYESFVQRIKFFKFVIEITLKFSSYYYYAFIDLNLILQNNNGLYFQLI